MKKFSVLTLIFILFFLIKTPLQAATISLSSDKTQIQSSDELDVSVSLSINVATSSGYYLRGVFYKPNTTSYCGYTWNGTSWFSGPYSTNAGWKNFFPITINDDKWNGTIKVKIDPRDSGCKDSGIYSLKIQRFTASGNSTFDSQIPLTFEISLPIPTLSPVPTQKPAKTTETLTISPEAFPTITSEPTVYLPTTFQVTGSAVLGISADPTIASPTAKPMRVKTNRENKTKILGISTLSIGVILILLCGIIMIFVKKKGKIGQNENS